MASKPDAAYLAGLIDGEGHVTVCRTDTSKSAKGCTRGLAYRSSITVAMTDLPVLEWAKELTGLGSICSKKVNEAKHKPAWTWGVWSGEARTLAGIILPYARIKRAQLENLIAFQSAMRQPGRVGLTDEEWDARERAYLLSQQLNRRGD